jgi:hypothetical protein
MPRKKAKPETSDHKIDGHQIRIVRDGDQERLWIDGERRRFFKYAQGYVLADNAYVPPSKSLVDAVGTYLKQSEREALSAEPAQKRGDR